MHAYDITLPDDCWWMALREGDHLVGFVRDFHHRQLKFVGEFWLKHTQKETEKEFSGKITWL